MLQDGEAEMGEGAYLLAIDQGTTSSRAIVFDTDSAIRGLAQKELTQYYPRDGWVEHDAEEIWRDTVAVCREAIARAGIEPGSIAAVGITNQRETVVVWDRRTGRPVHRAIVWQDRRTAEMCRELLDEGFESHVQTTTGLVIDPYFSATKLAWLLEHVEGLRPRAERGELAFGTIDSYLLFRLTGGRVHATDVSNASRTMLWDIHRQRWDEALLERLGIPSPLLPEVRDTSGDFGTTEASLLGRPLPVRGIAGDQQAASFGQACFRPGTLKSTYGTGCFALLNTGEAAVPSRNRLLTTIAWRLGGRTTYALEGSIFVAGAAIQWVRDGLGLIRDAAESEAIARELPDAGGVYFVPAFTGLGAPHWDPHARGAILGLTRGTTGQHIVRAALEAICYQSADLLEAMADDLRHGGVGALPEELRVDGGMVANSWFCQYLADILARPVDRPRVIETTALGAAYLAGLGAGIWSSPQEIEAQWQRERRFLPAMPQQLRAERLAGWAEAVARVRSRDRGSGAHGASM